MHVAAPRTIDLGRLCAMLGELRRHGVAHVNPLVDVRAEVREGRVTVVATGQTFPFEGEAPPTPEGAQGFVFRRDAEGRVVLSWAY